MPQNRRARRLLGHQEDLLVVLPFQNQETTLFLLFQQSKGDLGGLLWGTVPLLLTAILVWESV